MAARTEVRGHAAATEAAIDVREIPRRRRLQRALAQPEILEEFLVDPEDVARRFDVSLSEDELALAQRLGHLVFEWDQVCSDRRWIDAIDAPDQDRARVRVSDSLERTLEREVRNRIANEILEDLPEAIRRAADRFGADALVRPELPADEELPPQARSIRRVVRAIARRVAHELEREFDGFAFHRALTARPAAPRPAPVRQDEEAPARHEADAAQDIRIAALRRQVVAAALRGIEDAIQRVRPAPAEAPERRALRAQDLAAVAAAISRNT
ncbi:MAG TPA: hypothetical protein VIL18_05095 [Longimicrobiales bacterium]